MYEISTGRVTAVNAAHECPLIVSGNGVREIEEDTGYDRMIKALSAANASAESTEKDDLYGSLQREVGAVQDAVFDFVGDKALSVDISMMVIGRRGS